MSGRSDKKTFKDAQAAWTDTDSSLIERLEETMLHAQKLSYVRMIRFICWWLEYLTEYPVPSGPIDEMFQCLVYAPKDKRIPLGIYMELRRIRREVLIQVMQDHDLDDDQANRLIDLEGCLTFHLGEIVRWINPHHDY